jgi:glycosyltransferase involved in cell wall biosynthesis
MFATIKNMAKCMDLDDVLHFYGQVDNSTVQKAMQCHHAFLFTSDKREGWGVVANEAMNNGCLLIASNEIGSIPYLVKDMQTGIKYENCNLHELYEKLYKIIDNHATAEQIIMNAYSYIREVWSPENAADKFLALVHALQAGDKLYIADGPCAVSTPV